MSRMKKNAKSLLIIEDDPGLQSQLRWCFDEVDNVLVADDRESAIDHLRQAKPQVVTLDLGLPPDPGGATVGFALLDEILASQPNTKVIVVTGREETENAVKAIGKGAYDFYQKPIDPDILSFIVNRAYRLSDLEEENRKLTAKKVETQFHGVIASSPQMDKVCRMIEKVAPTDATTLVLGETGTGKEVLAKLLHQLSNRSEQKFSAINCAAIPSELLESELFGHEKGAFTGATTQKKGKIENTNGGTLFLDEIGDMPMLLQAKLLRFLQERVVERVGGTTEIQVDVRVICATHQNLHELIAEKKFREDLYFRTSEIVVNVPPVRERVGEAVVLAQYFLAKYKAGPIGTSISGFTEEALVAIENYPWPGNVREIENRVKRACIMAEGDRATAADLELESVEVENELPLTLREIRDNAETIAIKRAISRCGGSMTKAAKILGITRPTFYSLIKKYNIQNPVSSGE